MKLISHRGNLTGPNLGLENKTSYILSAIENKFDVEIDVWLRQGAIYLGHDEPQYLISKTFLDEYNSFLWCHAKNSEALSFLLENNYHCFWHQKDDYTITSKGFIWCYPKSEIVYNSICLFPETTKQNIFGCIGICSDYIQSYR